MTFSKSRYRLSTMYVVVYDGHCFFRGDFYDSVVKMDLYRRIQKNSYFQSELYLVVLKTFIIQLLPTILSNYTAVQNIRKSCNVYRIRRIRYEPANTGEHRHFRWTYYIRFGRARKHMGKTARTTSVVRTETASPERNERRAARRRQSLVQVARGAFPFPLETRLRSRRRTRPPHVRIRKWPSPFRSTRRAVRFSLSLFLSNFFSRSSLGCPSFSLWHVCVRLSLPATSVRRATARPCVCVPAPIFTLVWTVV